METVVNYSSVNSDANDLKDCVKRMVDIFDNFTKENNKVVADFEGSAAEAYNMKISEFKKTLTTYSDMVNKFADRIIKNNTETEEDESRAAERANDIF